MNGRVDFHSHILPGADHGSDGVATSLRSLALLKEAGVQKIVATPHFYPQRVSIDDFLQNRARCASALKEAVKGENPTVYLGAEVLICRGMEELRGLPKLCIEGTDCLLLEMPFRAFDEQLLDTVYRITQRGDVRPVMAHIDRYGEEDVAELMDLDVSAQINATALAGFFKKKPLLRYIEEGRVCALASDLHMASEATVKKYKKGLAKLGEPLESAVNARASALLEHAIPLF